jgi:hypothetical protein
MAKLHWDCRLALPMFASARRVRLLSLLVWVRPSARSKATKIARAATQDIIFPQTLVQDRKNALPMFVRARGV